VQWAPSSVREPVSMITEAVSKPRANRAGDTFEPRGSASSACPPGTSGTRYPRRGRPRVPHTWRRATARVASAGSAGIPRGRCPRSSVDLRVGGRGAAGAVVAQVDLRRCLRVAGSACWRCGAPARDHRRACLPTSVTATLLALVAWFGVATARAVPSGCRRCRWLSRLSCP
jgi:hypothetical protein